MNSIARRYWVGIPPWIILGALAILTPIFIYWAVQNINKQKEDTTLLLLEKAVALIRSFEAGARTGMLGMMGMHERAFKVQNLLMETAAQQPDIVYLIVTDIKGNILAHSNPLKIGGVHGTGLDLEQIFHSDKLLWRQVINPDGTNTFEVFRNFSPELRPFIGRHGGLLRDKRRILPIIPMFERPGQDQIIFVGLDMGPIEAARKAGARHTLLMALILLLIGFAGVVSLFLAQAYRSAKTSLTRIKAFSDTVVENMPIGLLTVDPDGKIASFNQTAEAILKLSSREALGKRADEVLPEKLFSFINQRSTKKGVVEEEVDCVLKDCKTIPLEVGVSSLEGEDGTPLGDIVLFRDLTEVRDLKREIERNQRLASLGSLAAGVAHEIRNPLSSIKGFATYFRERYKEVPEDLKIADIMVQEVERLNRVIGQLLQFARPMEISKKPTSIHTLIDHSLKMIEGQAQARNIEIHKSLSSEIEDVYVDPDRINQV
ncbi:MAG TPA: histidine kinase dimerization/phospho-acceptor domain-containing protein, partial [Desulfatiglandales bacterium]|nr:histidine kinase dimerization/phospho-acceptor domain-containing protein [Desulfatiglandales bacterium]